MLKSHQGAVELNEPAWPVTNFLLPDLPHLKTSVVSNALPSINARILY